MKMSPSPLPKRKTRCHLMTEHSPRGTDPWLKLWAKACSAELNNSVPNITKSKERQK